MELIGFREMEIANLVIDGDFRMRIDSVRVQERAKSMARIGQIHEPIVRMPQMRLLTGRDRAAAHVVLGHSKMTCKLVSCTDQEALEIELAENAHRRHDTEEQRRSMQRIFQLYTDQEIATPALPNSRGRRKAVKKKALLRLASERGIKPESLRRNLIRGRNLERKRDEKAGFIQGASEVVCPIELIGMEVTPDFMRDIKIIIGQTRELLATLHKAQVILTNLASAQGGKLPLQRMRFQRLYDEIKACGAAARGIIPISLCPWCKGLDGIQENCNGCVQTGWISRDQMDQVPRDLWNTGSQAYIAHAGRYRKLNEVLDEIAPRPAPVTSAEMIDHAAEVVEGKITAGVP